MADYIASADITDSLISELTTEVTAKIALSTEALNDLAWTRGVAPDDIETDVDADGDGSGDGEAHYCVRKWCEYWVCEMICLDMIGKNNDPVLDDKWHRKFELYHKMRTEEEKKINAEVLTGTADTAPERNSLGTALIFRG